MNTVWVIYENADKTEGRGPMVITDHGFFLSEDEAYKVADTLTGTMGVKPPGGSWRNANSGCNIKVEPIHQHNSEYHKKKYELEEAIKDLHDQLFELKKTRRL